MKLCIYTDNHFSQYSSIVRGNDGKTSVRLKNQVDSINWVEELAVAKNCDMIACLGDFFDKSELNAPELTALQSIKWSNLKHIFLVGNHEMGARDLSCSSAHLLQMVPNSEVIDKVTVDYGYGYYLWFIPYILETDRKTLKEYMDEEFKKAFANMFTTQEYKKTIVLSHNDISGIRYGQYLSTAGFDIKDIEDNCSLYINGHLHNQTQISKKILNLGNLTGQNFSEDAEKYSHCAAILDTDTLEIELINNPYALNFYKFSILSQDDFNKIDICKECSALSIKTYQSLVDSLKVYLNSKSNIVNYRLITLPENTQTVKQDIKELVKFDHIEQFKNYIVENIEQDDLLINELSLIN